MGKTTLDHSDIELADYIELALLHPAATQEQLQQCCAQAAQYNFPAVCVYPSAVRQATELLHGASVKVCTVIGFPAGATTSAVKLYEAQEAVEGGATELDVVINLGWLKTGKTEAIYREMAALCAETGHPVKAILETALLTPTEKRLAAEICMDAGVAYLKTSTGWFGGATVADVHLLGEIAKGRVGIKAAGGIRTAQQALELIVAGATRLGTSRGVELLRQRKASDRDTLEGVE
ncbi:MAG: deoxyribose-phosphate aldolase [Cyanobacteriota bacterium]|nr:deoxyribose-phosphate aldolase [Cyanobacteriota bacterium]